MENVRDFISHKQQSCKTFKETMNIGILNIFSLRTPKSKYWSFLLQYKKTIVDD